jgi:hypothetical protein
MRRTNILEMKPAGNPWVRVWAKSQTHHGYGFLMDIDIFHGYEFGMAKPSVFVPVAISIWIISFLQEKTKETGKNPAFQRGGLDY